MPLHARTSIPASRPAGRRERRRTEIRERLYRAALGLFAERGYFETTVEDITEAADVGKGTFFNHFPTKEHVLAAFGMERIAAIEHVYEEARHSGGPVLPLLRELATTMAGQTKESPALLRAIYAAHATCTPVREELQKRLQQGRRVMAQIFALGQERMEVRRDIPAIELARRTQLIFMGVALGWAMNPEGSLRKAGEDIWNLYFPSLEAKAAKGPHHSTRKNGSP